MHWRRGREQRVLWGRQIGAFQAPKYGGFVVGGRLEEDGSGPGGEEGARSRSLEEAGSRVDRWC